MHTFGLFRILFFSLLFSGVSTFLRAADTISEIDYWEVLAIRMQLETSDSATLFLMNNTPKESGHYYFLKGLSVAYLNTDSTLFYLNKARDIYENQKDEKNVWHVRGFAANFKLLNGNYDNSLEELELVYEYAKKHDLKFLLYYSQLTLAKAQYLFTNFEISLQYTDEALKILTPDQELQSLGGLYMRLCNHQMFAGDYNYKGEVNPYTHAYCIAEAESLLNLCEKYKLHCLWGQVMVLRNYSAYESEAIHPDTLEIVYDGLLNHCANKNCGGVFDFALINKAQFMAKYNRPFDATEAIKEFTRRKGDLNYKSWMYKVLSKLLFEKGDLKNAYLYLDSATFYLRQLHARKMSEASAAQEVSMRTFEKELENIKLNEEISAAAVKQERVNLIFMSIFLSGLGVVISVWLYNKRRIEKREQLIFARTLVEGEQKERMRIARDLHDSVGQMLSAIKMNVNALKDDPEAKSTMGQLIDKTIGEVRSISHNLIPEALDKFGLLVALEDLSDSYNISGREILEIDCRIPEQEINSISQQESLMLYRIIQESVQNIIKHNAAPAIQIIIHKQQHNLLIDLCYAGPPISREKLNQGSGIGWKNIMSRLSLLNGEISFSHANSQTIINMKLNPHGSIG